MKNYVIITGVNTTNSAYASNIIKDVLGIVLIDRETLLTPDVVNTVVLKDTAVSKMLANNLINELHTLGIDVTYVSEEETEIDETEIKPKMNVLLMHVKDGIATSNLNRYKDSLNDNEILVPFLFGRDVYNLELESHGYLDFSTVVDTNYEDRRTIKDAIVIVSEFILSEIDEVGNLDVTFNILVNSVVDYASELYTFSECRDIVSTLYDKGVNINVITKNLDDSSLSKQQLNILGIKEEDLTMVDELCVYKEKKGESLIRKPIVKLMN
tara:strand:+ start:196 stop:1002 length:807 start_codon:yes stop_codon:yes gene_type:complete